MSKEFNLDDFRTTPPEARQKHKGDLFVQLWRWQLHLLLGKRATGQFLRLFLVLVDKDFDEFGKPFTVTTQLAEKAGIDRKAKAKILQTFEQWGLIFLEQQEARKNPRVFLRKRQGRGENPFLRCR